MRSTTALAVISAAFFALSAPAGAASKAGVKAGRFNITEMTFKDNGMTGKGMWIWSGDALMDLERYQALKMTVKNIDGSDYLFIEAGGFSTKNPEGWQSPLYVLKRVAK